MLFAFADAIMVVSS